MVGLGIVLGHDCPLEALVENADVRDHVMAKDDDEYVNFVDLRQEVSQPAFAPLLLLFGVSNFFRAVRRTQREIHEQWLEPGDRDFAGELAIELWVQIARAVFVYENTDTCLRFFKAEELKPALTGPLDALASYFQLRSDLRGWISKTKCEDPDLLAMKMIQIVLHRAAADQRKTPPKEK